MTLQGEGLRSVLHKDGIIASSLTKENSCDIEVTQNTKLGIRVQLKNGMINTLIEDGDEVSYKKC